jgi:hypothetical protein
MKTCPNCSKKLYGEIEYCNECGSRIDGSVVGDFRTDLRFVFSHPDKYIFVNSRNGRQIVLEAKSIQELELLVKRRGFIWTSKNDGTRNPSIGQKTKAAGYSSMFLQVSAGNDVIVQEVKRPASHGTRKSADNFLKAQKSESPKIKSGKVSEASKSIASKPFVISNRHVKRNPDVATVGMSFKNLPMDYGILGVSSEVDHGIRFWVYRSNNPSELIRDRSLSKLKNKVMSKGLKWEITDEYIASWSFDKDREMNSKSNHKVKSFDSAAVLDIKEKSKILNGVMESRAVRANGEYANLDKLHR